MRPRRRYLAGAASAHIVGYLGEINARELEELTGREYEAGMIVGKEGVERYYESRLQGLRGNRVLEVDARGRIVGSFTGVPGAGRPAEPGQDLRLNIDLELQKWVHGIFPESMRGAVVALNVEDGGVLALYSSPTFDPNRFIGGIGQAQWAALNQDPNRPLFNRAVQGLYAPGSTWKLATAAIALDLGLVTPEEVMPLPCEGGLQYGNRFFRCWRPEGHGAVNLLDGIRHSCDTYFYQLGLRIGLERLLSEATRIGFNERCGIDLPAEAYGIFPDSISYWQDQFGYRAREGEVLNLAIGQGPNSQTPLKMAQFYVAVARDGTAPAPRLARSGIHDEGGWSLELSPEALETMREGLRRVVQPGGTAYLASLEHWDLMGKTGRPPEVVVVVIVEFGVSGSAVAAPLVAKTADYYLRRKYGVPLDTIQTLGEHYRAGVPAPWALRMPQGNQ
jgi:penicillin-binding protein 2